LNEYDGVEMHPVAREVIDGKEYFEQCDRDYPDIHYWSVYLHMVEGGISCIADCPDEETALFVERAVEALLFQEKGISVNAAPRPTSA